MNKHIKLASDTISKSELFKLSKWIINAKILTKSKLTIKFEKIFADWNNSKYAVFVNSGSSANLLIAQALLESNILKNKTIIMPSVSWATTIAPFIQLGFNVILCDTDKKNLGLDINHLENLIKKFNPSCISLCHVLGHANNIKGIKRLTKNYNIEIIEDTCESLGTTYFNKKLGNFGLASSFSFYYGHHISTIEGGMVCTNDKSFYNLLVSIRSHGWSRDWDQKYQKKISKQFHLDEFTNLYTFYNSGFNIRSTDLNAYLGINQMKKIDKIIKTRNRNYKYYKTLLKKFWHQNDNNQFVSSFAFGTIVKNRFEVYRYLKSKKIECRPLICGSIGRQPFWIKKFGKPKLLNADLIHDYGIYLPNHANLTKNQIRYICKCFLEIAKPIYFDSVK